jgi:hypothetical protein
MSTGPGRGHAGSRAALAGPLVAVVLVVTIAWLTVELLPVIRAEARLRRAATLIPDDPLRGLQMLEKGSSGGASPRQQARGAELAREAVGKVCCGRAMLRKVGTQTFDPLAPPRPYVTGSRDMPLVFELPAGLRDLGGKVRITDGERELCEVRFSDDGTKALAEVPLMLGSTVRADVDFVCPVGVFGTVTAAIAPGLKLVQQSHGPVVKLLSGQRVDPLRDGATLRLPVAKGTPLKLELSDELGLWELEWRLGGVARAPFDWSEQADSTRREVELPADLTAAAADATLLEFKAANASGATTSFQVELLVREIGGPPLASARIGGNELTDGSTIVVGQRALPLLVTMGRGEVGEDLGVIWGDEAAKTRVSGHEVSALLEAAAEGPRSLALTVRGETVLRATVRFDWTPPVIGAIADPEAFPHELDANRAVHEVPIGSELIFTITDAGGLDPGLTEWTVGEGLEELRPGAPESRDSEPLRMWTRRYRCEKSGEVRVRVAGFDLAGNRSTIHEYRIRGADPMEGRALTLNGKPFTRGCILHSKETRFVVRSEGGIDVDGLAFSLLDPEQRNASLGHALLERTDAPGVRAAVVDLSFLATSGRHIIGILSRNQRELLRGEVVVDFAPPTFKVNLVEAGGAGQEGLRYFGKGGELVSLTLTDDVGVDVSTVSVIGGAEIEKLAGDESGTGVVLILPPVIEEAVVLTAADRAGNKADLRFEVVPPPASESRSPSTLPPRPESAPSEPPPPSLEELQRTPKVTVPLLGTFLLIPVREPGILPFYIGEHEVTVAEWRAFVDSQAANRDGQGRQQFLWNEASQLLTLNKKKLMKEDDDPLAGVTSELLKAYVAWAKQTAGQYGTWRVPTSQQWKLAAGRALHPDAVYPTTNAFPSGSDLTSAGMGGASFGHDALAAQELPRRAYQPGAFGLRGMAGSLYEWVTEPSGQYRLIGGSAVSPKEACRLDAPLRAGIEVASYERGVRLVLMPGRR